MQRAAANQEEVSTAPPIVHEGPNSPGQPLDSNTRALMEPRFGYDFGQLRVHDDERASMSAPAVNALSSRPVALQRQHDDPGQKKPFWLTSTTGGLEPISLQSAYRRSHQKKSMFPGANDLVGKPATSLAMAPPEAKPPWLKERDFSELFPTGVDREKSLNERAFEKMDEAINPIIKRWPPLIQKAIRAGAHAALKEGESRLLDLALDPSPLDAVEKKRVHTVLEVILKYPF